MRFHGVGVEDRGSSRMGGEKERGGGRSLQIVKKKGGSSQREVLKL